MMASTTASTALATRPEAAPPTPEFLSPEPRVAAAGSMTTGTLLVFAAEVMVFAALVAAYFLTRTSHWFPKEFFLDNYRGTTLIFTVILASGAAQWAVHAARLNDQRNVTVALWLAFGLILATADLAYFTMTNAGIGASGSTFGSLYYAMLGAFLVACWGAGLVVVLCATKATSGQFNATHHQPLVVASMLTHALTVGWLFIFAAIWIFH